MSTGPLLLPVEACYWGLLDAVDRRLGAAARRFRFEAVLPLPVDGLQVASVRLPDGRILLVGIERQRLASAIAAGEAWQARPAALPAHLEADLDPGILDDLELLHGDFEPPPRRRLRRAACATLVGGLLLASLLLVLGARRQAGHHAAAAQAARAELTLLADAAVPQQPGAQALPAALRLEQELRRARQAARSAGPDADLLPVLESLWRAWPRELRIQLDTVGLDAGRLVLRGRAPDPETAQVLAAAIPRLQLPVGSWRAEPLDVPKVDAVAATFLLAFTPVVEAP